MKRASKFVVSSNWLVLLKDIGVDLVDVLTVARLPADLFNQETPTLTPEEYFRFFQGIATVAGEQNIALLLAEHLSVESFDPAVFACICSPDLNTALTRLSKYKPLIGPILLDVQITDKKTRLDIDCYGHEGELPTSLGVTELVFFTQLARISTREKIKPLALTLPDLPKNKDVYHEYFGCHLKKGKTVSITFTARDAQRPFLTSNAAMWNYFEGNLKQRLKDLDSSATIVDRVRAVLVEALPGGDSSMERIARQLAMSKRTLQRKLTDEAETYQSVLKSVRAELADHYLQKSHMSLGEISFMLGFQEANSFIRAYSSWKGVSPGQYRDQLQ